MHLFLICYKYSTLFSPNKVSEYFDNYSVLLLFSLHLQFVFFLDCFVVPPRKDAKRRNSQDIKKERVPTFLIPLDGSGKPYQKMRKSGLLISHIFILALHGAKIGAFRRAAMEYSEL